MLAPHRKSRFGKTQTQPRVSTDTAAGDNNSSPMAVLPSSTDLFYLYGQVLEQCAKLSAGQPLYDLCTLFKKWLRIYAGMSGVMWLAYPLKLTTLCRGGTCDQYKAVITLFQHRLASIGIYPLLFKACCPRTQVNRIWSRS